jgi:AraC-like DNA-binding protein
MSLYRIFKPNDLRGTLQIALPKGHLVNFVEFFWQSEFDSQGDEFVYSHALPNYSGLLSFNLTHSNWQSRELLNQNTYIFHKSKAFGSLPYSCLCQYPKGLKQAGIKLKPGALSMLLKIPAEELQGLKADMEDFFNIDVLEDQLGMATSFEQRVYYMEAFLNKIFPVSSIDYRYHLVQEALTRFDPFMPYGNAIQKIAQDLCVTPKSLNRYFIQWVGVSPKWCLKVHRFTKTLAAYQQSSNHLAFELYGYNDHSHVYKDAIMLTGRPISHL